SLRQFEAHITGPEDDQMRRQVIEFESLDMGERPGSRETKHGGNCRTRSDVDENLRAGEYARPAIIESHLQRVRRHEAPVTNDQLGTGRLVIVQMRSDLAADHVALALNYGRHVGGHGTGHHAELRTVTRQMSDLRAPNLVLAGQAGDVGAGAADPA